MSYRRDELPVPDRSDASLAVLGTWRVGTPARQRAAAAAVAAAWDRRPWPGPELLSYAVLAGEGGETLLHYAQQADDAGPPQDRTWKDEVDAEVPGIERIGVVGYRPYRSNIVSTSERVGCIVVVLREFDGPDLARAAGLVDTLFESGEGSPSAEGLVSAHFHLSVDGSRVLNYARWTSAQAHRAAIEDRPQETLDNRQWQKAHAWPGLLSTTFERFDCLVHLAPG